MTTRKKKVFTENEYTEEGLMEEGFEENLVNDAIEESVETPVEVPSEELIAIEEEEIKEPEPVAEKIEEIKPVTVEKVVKEPKMKTRQKPPAPVERRPLRNSPKFSSRLR
jgi:hypothetical protein